MTINTREVLEVLEFFESSEFVTLEVEFDGIRLEASKNGKPLPARVTYSEARNGAVTSHLSSGVAETLRESPPQPASTPPALDTANSLDPGIRVIRSPMIGTFYRSPGPGEAPFKQIGDSVAEGEVLCLVECMKLFNSIEADCSGVVSAILVENGQMVEYDQPLLHVRKK